MPAPNLSTENCGATGRPREIAPGVRLNDFGCLPKLLGADVELGNAILGGQPGCPTGLEAAEAILLAMRRQQMRRGAGRAKGERGADGLRGHDPQDRGRTWLASNGGCAYIDLDHLELCIPEVLSACDAVAALHAVFRLAAEGVAAANARLPEGQRLIAAVNNSDGHGHSYGGHLNCLLKRSTYKAMFDTRPQYLLFLAACQATSLVLTGAGKVGAENGAPPVAYQISQRADFIECLHGPQTTMRRPVVNSRDEALCGVGGAWGGGNGVGSPLARLHLVFYDSTLCHVATLLRFGLMQIVLSMIEAGRVCPDLLLEDPVEATHQISHDPGLQGRIRLASGAEISPVDHQRRLFDAARQFVDAGGCAGVVPQAQMILEHWGRTLDLLARREFATLARRLDWVLKLAVLEAVRQSHGLAWDAPELRQLDFQYGMLGEGLYWIYEREGAVDRLVPEAAVARLTHEPPANTRAWTRAALLRRAPPAAVDEVDWDRVRFHAAGPGGWPGWRSVQLANPLGFTQADCQGIFQPGRPMEEILDRLDALADTGGVARAVHQGESSVGPVPERPQPTVSVEAGGASGDQPAAPWNAVNT